MTLTKMFTYKWYSELIHTGIDAGVNFFLRHDVDISLKKALEMAEIEAKQDFHSTYYILLSSPFYNAFDVENLERIRMIKELGMGIGLHFDASITNANPRDISREIMVQINLLQYYIGRMDGLSVTFHKPFMGVDVGTETVDYLNQQDIYSPNHDTKFKYISDSGHNWREDPVETILSYNYIHLNTHPEWYNKKEQSMEECLMNLRIDLDCDKKVIKEINHIQEYLEKLNDKKIP